MSTLSEKLEEMTPDQLAAFMLKHRITKVSLSGGMSVLELHPAAILEDIHAREAAAQPVAAPISEAPEVDEEPVDGDAIYAESIMRARGL